VLIPPYGMWAAAWLTVLSETCVFAGAIVVTRRYTTFSFPWKRGLSAAAAALFMAICIWLTRNLTLVIGLFVAFATYPAALYAFGGISKETIKEILAFRKHPNLETPPTENL